MLSASPRRAPDFFIVGHPKCGTTALYEMLRRNPQVYMPDLKEPDYFARYLRYNSEVGASEAPSQTLEEYLSSFDLDDRARRHHRLKPGTLEDYLSLFDAASPEQCVGEASPIYLWSQTAAGGIAEVQPAARIVAILREPADFLRSLHLQFVRAGIETELDFGTAISLEEDRRRGVRVPNTPYWPEVLFYSDHVRYVEQLRRYRDQFPLEHMLVLIYDDFRRDNAETVRTVSRFLGVSDTTPIEAGEVNTTVRVRFERLDDLLHAVSVGRGPVTRVVNTAVKALMPRRLRRYALDVTQRHIVYAESPPADENVLLELRRRFQPEVVALGEYLDRDLVSLWGYDV